ncbi:MAG: winged helix-turn-helix transcriptional regulator [Candidatus Altiarchaeales archaeon]|nr:winged helix-turn-helix transcriptional regulator [Candidatus Altiarchaeales archaeon]MBD3416205.1 winged helix-turn-helix transcriptional regulator [Candidatus Altiarchaeales archaeon]
MDSLDREIIKNLQDDARVSLRELGRRLDVPHTTVFTRVKKLVKNGVIKKFSAVLHPHDLGFKLNFMVIDVPETDADNLAASISACEEVMKVFKTSDNKVIVKAIVDDSNPSCLEGVMSKIGDYSFTVHAVDDVVKFDHNIHDNFIDNL